MGLSQDLTSHLKTIGTAPFLFVGSGLSRRYLGLDDWTTLLSSMAALSDMPYSYYVSNADNNNPRIATLIAERLKTAWWTDDRFESSRAEFPNPSGSESALKIEVARYVRARAESAELNLGALQEEYTLLGSTVSKIDGVITTNYDQLISDLFPQFVPLVGQAEILFQKFQGVGEIYQIHGSYANPETKVLTERDYKKFDNDNPYLAAKLLTIFVEHPVIFLGYSLQDRNIQRILGSIANVLSPGNILKLQDRLIFVDWSEAHANETMETSILPVAGSSIPIKRIQTARFEPVYEAIAATYRQYDARILRHLKAQVYELVRTSKPTSKIRVVDFSNDVDLDTVDVVIGVAINDRLAVHGLVGVRAYELFSDLLSEESIYTATESKMIVTESLRNQFSGAVPFYRWLRSAGLLSPGGQLLEADEVLAPIQKRVLLGDKYSKPADGIWAKKVAAHYADLPALIDGIGSLKALTYLWMLPRQSIDLAFMRTFLINTRAEHGTKAAWKKSACLYDYLAFAKGI